MTELFISFIHRGYGGWFDGSDINPSSPIVPSLIKKGWEFNVGIGLPNEWWKKSNNASNTELESQWYLNDGKKFFYTKALSTGDTIMGDICEYNDYEQKERIVSKYINKIRFNQSYFNTNTNPLFYSNENLPDFIISATLKLK